MSSINAKIINALSGILSVTTAENPQENSNADTFGVIVPVEDAIPLWADNLPLHESEEVYLEIYTKGNYLALRDKVTARLIAADITIASRRYVQFEQDTRYHHYTFDLKKIKED